MTAEAPTRTTWTLDPSHTLLEFSAKHMMVTTVKGRFTDFAGTIVGNLEDPTAAEIDITIHAHTIDTRNEQRDGHLRSEDFLHTEQFPTLTFKSTEITKTGDDTYDVTGDLTIRGTTRPVTLKTEINGVGKTPFGTEVVGVSAKGQISRKDFGLNWNVALETGGVLVSDTVKIDLEVQAVKGA